VSDGATSGAPGDLLAHIRGHLEGLKSTTDGAGLYKLIERGLVRYGGPEAGMAQAFVNFLDGLLTRYVNSGETDPVTRVKARLIQQRLALLRLQSAMEAVPVPAQAPAAEARSVGRWTRVAAMTGGAAAAPVAAVSDASVSPAVAQARADDPAEAATVEPAASPAEVESQPYEDDEPEAAVAAERLELLEEELASDVTRTLTGGSEFVELMARAERELPVARAGNIRDFSDLRAVMVNGMDELIREHESLKLRLAKAAGMLAKTEDERRRLVDDLNKARKHSMLDDLTGLPRRDVFMRQLRAEIGRARRYGFSLAVALIDLDDLSQINEHYGRDAGDRVLRCYAGEILSRFRSYDLVARYGGDELAVLFPNTQKDGAMQALEKARKSAAETYIHANGSSFPLPTFSSVLTVYVPGEQPDALLKRADEALDHAKRDGRDRIVFALPGG
jgi:diguanylate cyclase (GGDEF)-like protein